MIYIATVQHYEEWDDKMKTSYMFVCADSTVKAVQQISDQKNLMSCSMISLFMWAIMQYGRRTNGTKD